MTVYYLRFFFTIIQAGGWTGAEKLMSHFKEWLWIKQSKKQSMQKEYKSVFILLILKMSLFPLLI